MRIRRILSIATCMSAVTLILTACSDDSATPASNAASASATTSTQDADSTIKRITVPPTTTTAAAETTSGKDLHGTALYLQTCHDTLEYFDAVRELADMVGEPFDSKQAADGLLELARTGGDELLQDLEASGDIDVPAADPSDPRGTKSRKPTAPKSSAPSTPPPTATADPTFNTNQGKAFIGRPLGPRTRPEHRCG